VKLKNSESILKKIKNSGIIHYSEDKNVRSHFMIPKESLSIPRYVQPWHDHELYDTVDNVRVRRIKKTFLLKLQSRCPRYTCFSWFLSFTKSATTASGVWVAGMEGSLSRTLLASDDLA
jgi:hypothetical protein